jgi:hypothetical protein
MTSLLRPWKWWVRGGNIFRQTEQRLLKALNRILVKHPMLDVFEEADKSRQPRIAVRPSRYSGLTILVYPSNDGEAILGQGLVG